MLDPVQYKFLFLFTTLADPEPEPKLRYSGSGSSQKFQFLAAPAPQHLSIVRLLATFVAGAPSTAPLEASKANWNRARNFLSFGSISSWRC
jgi:hypothetical protein